MNCDQCGKPAITSVRNHPLCVSCYALLRQAETASLEASNDYLRLLSAHQNQLLEQAELAVGLPLHLGRIQIPTRPAQQHNTFHNVKVEGGTVGAINTGEAHSITVAIGNAEKQGRGELSEALQLFTEELANAKIPAEKRSEIAEQLAAVSEELTKPAEARRRAVIGPMLDGLNKAVSISAGLMSLWDKLHPLLIQALK